MDRRHFFLQGSSLLLASAATSVWSDDAKKASRPALASPTPVPAPATGKPKSSVIVIGGGMAGAAVAVDPLAPGAERVALRLHGCPHDADSDARR